VIGGFEQLFAATQPDFAPIYREIARLPEVPANAVLPDELSWAEWIRAD